MPSEPEMTDALDRKVTQVFAGKVVRKELVRKLKFGSTVPVYVLEYLLGKYCATDDPLAVEAGLKIVNSTLAENFVRPDEANRVQSLVKEKGRYTLIDKVKVRYLSDDDKYWAEIVNFGHKFVHVPDRYVRQFDRLLVDGVWCEVELRHEYDDQASGKRSPFWIEELKPIQVAAFDLSEYVVGREQIDHGGMDRPADPLDWSGTNGYGEASEAAVSAPAGATGGTQLQLGGIGAARNRQEFCLPAIVAIWHPADRPDDGGESVLQHRDEQDRAGWALGRRGIRRGGGPAEDAQGSGDDAEDLLREWNVCSRQGAVERYGFDRDVRQHEPARGRDGALIAPFCANAGCDSRGHGVSGPHPLLHPRLGNSEDADGHVHEQLWFHRGLSGRGLARDAPAELHRDHRS